MFSIRRDINDVAILRHRVSESKYMLDIGEVALHIGNRTTNAFERRLFKQVLIVFALESIGRNG